MSTARHEFWVAPGGDDRGPGTAERPLASLARALRRVREVRRLAATPPPGGCRIVMRGGVYRLDEPVFVRSEDAATGESPTRIEAAPGERPVLSGGVPVTGWRRAEDVPAGMPASARGQIWFAEAPQVGGRPWFTRQLWIGDRKAVRARSPNAEAMAQLLGWDREREVATIPAALVAGIAEPDGLEMVVAQQWAIAILRVREIVVDGAVARLRFHQPESRLEFEHPWPQPIMPPHGVGAFFLAHAAALLDAPGEWWQSPRDGRIHYWPRPGEDLARDPVVVPVLETLLRVEGTLDHPVAHVHWHGVEFAHAAWRRPGEAGHVPLQAGMPLLEAYSIDPPGTPDKPLLENQGWIGRMPAAVTVVAARDIAFTRCRFRQLAASGLDAGRGTRRDVVEGCLFHDLGGNGIQYGGFQDGGVETHVPWDPSDPREIGTGPRIANNLIVDAANEDWGCVGILVGYARDALIEHNEVRDVSYTAISVGWGWTPTLNCQRGHRIRANLLHRLATRMCDTAGVYTLSAQPGTVIERNCVHSLRIAPHVDRPDHWFYLYTDEGTAHVLVRDNWCEQPKFLMNANGPGNAWENNGPHVDDAVRREAGLEPDYRDLTGLLPAGA